MGPKVNVVREDLFLILLPSPPRCGLVFPFKEVSWNILASLVLPFPNLYGQPHCFKSLGAIFFSAAKKEISTPKPQISPPNLK